jgi:hypothetical protein
MTVTPARDAVIQPSAVRKPGVLTGWAHGAAYLARNYTLLKSDARWAAWIAGGVASFTVLQGMGFAEYPDHRHTLSAFSRRWLGVYPKRPRRIAASIGFLGALGVIAGHFLVDPPPYEQNFPDPNARYEALKAKAG